MERKLPPQDISAEMSILGSVFLENECLQKVKGMVEVDDFYRESHRNIFQMMLYHRKHGRPIDLVTSCKTLKEKGLLEQVGGAPYLTTLIDFVPTSANVAHYCGIVKEMAVRRKIISYSIKLSEKAYDDSQLDDIIPEAKTDLSEISASMDSFGGVSISDLTTPEMRSKLYQEQVKNFDKSRFKTGFSLLDQQIRGVAPGEVLTIIAEPGGFKTAFLQNLLRGGKERTKRESLFFSLEMPNEKVYEREMQMENTCSGYEVERHYRNIMTSIQMTTDLTTRGLIVCAKPRLNLEKMERYIELAKQKFGEIGVVGIDYLQLMQGPGKIFERIEHNAYGIKQLAVAVNLPFILLSQINTEGIKAKHDIQATEGKGGGAIFEAADFEIGFYHDEEGSLICKGLKNRNGSASFKYLVDINRVAFQFKDMATYFPPTRKKTSKEEDCPF